MFFKRYLTEKEIYKAALPIVRLQGRVNTSLRFLSKYSDVNKNGLIALHLNLLHFISYNIHGVESLKITQAGINKAVQQSPHADEIKNIAQAIGRKGPEYIEGLIRNPWGKKNDNPLIFIMSIEESIKETLNSGYMLYRVAPITEGEAAAFMDVLKQLLLFEDNFRLFGRDLVY
ncbi:hypothetical protein, partial [Klebsiella pneumoniae]